MKSWEIDTLDTKPHMPHILSSSTDARAIVLHLPAGERLQEHEVRERAWVVLVAGEVEITTAAGAVTGGPGLLVEFDPGERHELLARSDARFLLLLTPFPAAGHSGTMSLDQKAGVRGRAADHLEGPDSTSGR